MSFRDNLRTMDPLEVALLATFVVLFALAGVLWAGVSLFSVLTGEAVLSPPALLVGLARGRVHLGAGHWVTTGALFAILVGVSALLRRLRNRAGGPKRGDKAARLTGKDKDIQSLTEQAVAAKAKRLGVTNGQIGLPVGHTVSSGRSLWSSLEDVCILVAGPRTGKTTCWVIPRIFAARGAVVATSNKRDIVDDTRDRRSSCGPVWVFDPQGIADETQVFWWNPLSYVTDAVSATALADIFVDTTRDPKAQGSAFFDQAARNLVAGMLLAASRSGRPISELHGWLNNQSEDMPVRILREHGEYQMAETLAGTMNLVPETRSGVYGGAAQIMAWLVNEKAIKWVTPQGWLPHFDVDEFVRSTGTLYCLSQEGRGSASPIVTALTVAVTEAAIRHARTQPGGRLSQPMLIELDEAANVCRWRELPDLYSHFGSRGIQVDTILQSWAQGAQAWGEEGVRKLWSASNVKVYGGGVSEKQFLQDLSDMIGQHWVDSRQVSYSRQGRQSSLSQESQQRQIATVAELQALPAGRSWVLASGATPVLARTVPWWEADKAETKRGGKR